MTKLAAAIFILLLAALYVYFFGTPLASRLTGLAPRTISLLSGSAVMISALIAMMLGRIAARGGPRIDSRR